MIIPNIGVSDGGFLFFLPCCFVPVGMRFLQGQNGDLCAMDSSPVSVRFFTCERLIVHLCAFLRVQVRFFAVGVPVFRVSDSSGPFSSEQASDIPHHPHAQHDAFVHGDALFNQVHEAFGLVGGDGRREQVVCGCPDGFRTRPDAFPDIGFLSAHGCQGVLLCRGGFIRCHLLRLKRVWS